MQFWNGYSYSHPVKNDSTAILAARKFFREPAFVPNSSIKEDLRLKENSLRAKILEKDWGLKFATGYAENFNPAFNDDDNLIYNRRIQAGLNWDILHSGLIENRTLAKTYELQNLILQSVKLPGQNNDELTIKWNQIIYLFNLSKLKILNERLSLIRFQNKAAENLFLSKYLTKENYLENEKRLSEIQSLYNIYEDFNKQLIELGIEPQKDLEEFPLVDINYQLLFKSVAQPVLNDDTLLQVIRQKNNLQYKYYNQINLSAFMRYNYYDLVIANPANRSFMSAGLNLSVPLNFDQKEQKELAEVKSLNEYDRIVKEDESQEADMLDDCYEFRYKLKQYIVFYQKKLLFEELLRKEKARKTIDSISFNPYKAISMQDDILAIDLELVELKQNMYLKLLKINSRKKQTENNLFKPFLLNEHAYDTLNIKRSMYVWSNAFKNHSVKFITEYLIYHNIKEVALSAGQNDSLKNNITATNTTLRKSGIKTALLIGDNKFTEKNIDEYFKNNVLSPGDIDAVHIDYEPQTFDNWKEKKAQYLQLYFQKLKEARTYCNEHKLKLKIAIPLYYPEEDVNAMIELCDEVVFMAYENVNTKYITEKLNKYLAKKAKLAVALRTNDFTNRALLEEKLNEIARITGIENYYLHDLSRIVKWDENAIDKK